MKYSELLRLLQKDGWYILRQAKGSHLIMKHDIKPNLLTVPNHGAKEVGTGLANKILKDAGLK
jgi:predicted RNA binding protein YcfA (HicA-like mRNA interferase family)